MLLGIKTLLPRASLLEPQLNKVVLVTPGGPMTKAIQAAG